MIKFGDLSVYYWILFVVELLVAIVILDVVVSRGSLLTSVLSTRAAVWLGGISYGLYLWHYPIDRILYTFGFRGLTLLSAGACAALAAASASFYLIERPVLTFKNRLRLASRRA